MIAMKTLISGAAVLGALVVPFARSAPTPTPGPGGVMIAVRDFLAAVDRGDVEALRNALLDRRRGVDYTFDGDGALRPAGKGSAGASFFDVGTSGEKLAADDATSFAELLTKSVTKATSRIRTVRADCDSETCSWAVVEFERTFSDADQERVVPMRATVLCEYGKGTPHFRIFHWHASSAAVPANGTLR
jgi:hypothetical protein